MSTVYTQPISTLKGIVSAQKQGQAIGIPSICSAHPYVIEASFRQVLTTGLPVLIESTCNQVNQFGGYTGITPDGFIGYVRQIADACAFPHDRILFGGDHLGPSPWQDEPETLAMNKARTLVRDYVAAGYSKIHLDASMKCADDDSDRPLDKVVSARRAAELAAVAEETRASTGGICPDYVIGTEVPLPGGAQEHEDTLAVTTPDDVAETIDVTRRAFLERGVVDAWERVLAVVVQPGVEYGDSTLFDYDHDAALDLYHFIEQDDQLIFEAHSTDYQKAEALRDLVVDHFAILKVGPALTFAFRESVFALAMIEQVWLSGRPGIELSKVREHLDAAMLANPIYWQKYYPGDEQAQSLARRYSFSDRSRYFWPVPQVHAALQQLLANLDQESIPLTLLSQYLPLQYERIRHGVLDNSVGALVLDKITLVLDDYSYACGQKTLERR